MQKNGFTITPESGNGNGTINISAQKYYGDSDRTTAINVKTHDNKITKTINLVQKANTKTDINLNINVVYLGSKGNNYEFDVKWNTTDSIIQEEGAYLTIMISKSIDIDLATWNNNYNDNGGEKTVSIPKSNFVDGDTQINPMLLSNDDINYDIDLREQSFTYKCTNVIKKYQKTVNVTMTFKKTPPTVNTLYLPIITEIDYLCNNNDLILKCYVNSNHDAGSTKISTINKADLESLYNGDTPIISFNDIPIQYNDYRWTNVCDFEIIDPSENYLFKITKVKLEKYVRLVKDSDTPGGNVTFHGEIQVTAGDYLASDVIFSNIVTSEGDSYTGTLVVKLGQSESETGTIQRTDLESGNIVLDYDISGGDCIYNAVYGEW